MNELLLIDYNEVNLRCAFVYYCIKEDNVKIDISYPRCTLFKTGMIVKFEFTARKKFATVCA